MRCLVILICVLVQLGLVNRDLNERDYIQSNPLVSVNDIHSLDNTEKSGLSVLDTALIFVCFVLSYITYLLHRTNTKLRQNVKERCQKGATIIRGLQLFLEESRSKNSVIEMPIRKLARNSNKVKSDFTKQIDDLYLLQSQFNEFRRDWFFQAKPYLNTSEDQLRENVEAERELNALKCVANYNKSLLDEALDDVDRLMDSEGL